ncbi:RNA ligase family protein [Kitasatospora cathayae]|uniref:RNA ligase domain-containing protein n=1 Tax=Kitasatospora cathayae TaxID=3004092 RepID=A0ABY7Q304_9ACTN|nr:RNA ligase family protein [Kitasatospora sp. HUAS 3-15]WBP87027.1 hypothetical protein O1G21_15035 [Kitasatospora sp. HUAS 3-15]
MTVEFTPWPKTKRLFRDITVTEKLDGTNAAVHIYENADAPGTYGIAAQSRNRIITPDLDNYGFARWVHENASALAELLGPGLHFGEWWGRGIQRGYGLDERRFSLFNTDYHRHTYAVIGGVEIQRVPVLYQGTFNEARIRSTLGRLAQYGSVAAPGFMNPEGVCVWHSQTRQVLKVTLDSNDAGKWELPPTN